ncbi:hypothetical protein NKJ51_33845 [Mesorhizobium sp. M0134]
MSLAPDAVLLDNMSLADLRRAVAIVGGRAITEASGGIASDTARAIAATGVDLVSVGPTHPQRADPGYRPRLSGLMIA